MMNHYYDEDALEQLTSAIVEKFPMGNMDTIPSMTVFSDYAVCLDGVRTWYGDITDMNTFTDMVLQIASHLHLTDRVTIEPSPTSYVVPDWFSAYQPRS